MEQQMWVMMVVMMMMDRIGQDINRGHARARGSASSTGINTFFLLSPSISSPSSLLCSSRCCSFVLGRVFLDSFVLSTPLPTLFILKPLLHFTLLLIQLLAHSLLSNSFTAHTKKAFSSLFLTLLVALPCTFITLDHNCQDAATYHKQQQVCAHDLALCNRAPAGPQQVRHQFSRLIPNPRRTQHQCHPASLHPCSRMLHHGQGTRQAAQLTHSPTRADSNSLPRHRPPSDNRPGVPTHCRCSQRFPRTRAFATKRFTPPWCRP